MDYVIVDVICDDQPGLGWHCHRPLLKTTYPAWSFVLKVDTLSIAWIMLNKAQTDCDKALWHTSKFILLESVSTDIYKAPYFD